MQTAKLFKNGRSQAVRLPKNCRFSGDSVFIKKFEDIVMIFPEKLNPWSVLIESLDKFSEDYMDDKREKSILSKREDF
jgi:antitoxin VapB